MAAKLCCCIPFLSFSSADDEDGHDPASTGAQSSPSAITAESGSFSQTVPGAPQDGETPIYGSSNVSMKSEGEKVEVNLDLSGVPRGDEAPSSSHSSGATKDVAPVNLDKLMKDIAQLLKLIEEEKPTRGSWIWPGGSDLKELKEILSPGVGFLSELEDDISGSVQAILNGIGNARLATAGLLVVAYSLERFDVLSTNKEDCLHLLKEMSYVASLVKILNEGPKAMQHLIKEAAALIIEGAIICCGQIDSSPWKSLFTAPTNKDGLRNTTQKLLFMYRKIDAQVSLRVLTAIESKRKPPLSKGYPKHAVGIVEPIEEVLGLLACESDEKAVTVILHGFGGTGKTTLADAVFSKVAGCKYSKVRLFTNIDSRPDILNLQKEILKDLMGPQETIPDIRTEEDGQRVLGVMLEKEEAFIYIDNVLNSTDLQLLLPKNMDKVKKARFLLTARDVEDLNDVCPTPPKVYRVKGIQTRDAMIILKKEIREGINESEFNEIIEICGGIPLMLNLVAQFIGRADDKRKAYEILVQDKGKWEYEHFAEMRFVFDYDSIPDNCKDPFLDICSFFRGWNWDTVADIVGKDELETLQRRALVFKDANGLASVHNVILTLALQNSKDTRFTFSSTRHLELFLRHMKEEDLLNIKGIWLSENSDPVDISASRLDLMCNSLRVLALGNFIKVEGPWGKIFENLVFFQASITELPFNVSMSNKLRYLAYEPNDLNLSKIPSSLRHMEFDGRLHSDAFQISFTDHQQFGNLRILRLINFAELKNLPEKLGVLLNGLKELSLSYCESIEQLPESISKFQSLQILKMDHCTSFIKLPKEIGSLISLQELNLQGCSKLETLPECVDKLSSLTLLNLSYCENLLNLPPGLGNLTLLQKLDLNHCYKIKSIPESIRELKTLRELSISNCLSLKNLPHGFCNLSLITHISMAWFSNLEKLPNRFGQLASLRTLNLQHCGNLKKLPEGFGQLKYLEELVLSECYRLIELCNDFHCLSSLQILDLNDCISLEKLPQKFNCLVSLQHLYLCSCNQLEGKGMDHIAKMNRLQLVHIEKSEQLEKRWAEIQTDRSGSFSFAVTVGQGLTMSEANQKEIIEKNILSDLGRLLTNGRGEPADLPPNTLILVVCDLYPDYSFPWALIEETIDEMQIRFDILYIGPHFHMLPTKVKDRIFVCDLPEARAREVLKKVCFTLDEGTYVVENKGRWCLQMRTRIVGDGKSDKYRPCWKLLRDTDLEEFVLGNSRRYLRLKHLAEKSQESNIELLRELFASDSEDETTGVFQKNSPSQQGPFTCGVDKLKGKTIFFEMRPADLCYDIRLGFLKKLYVEEKEKLDLEIISIPILEPSTEFDVFHVYEQFSKEVPWLVLKKPWIVMTRVVKFFLAKQIGWEGGLHEIWYPSVNWIIDSNGRITAYKSSILSMLDRCEEVKILYKHLESVSYQVRWGAKAWPFNHERIEELRKEEWKQQKSLSPLEFIFNHLESVSDQVKKLLFQGKLICLYRGNDYGVTCSVLNAMMEVSDIHIIHISKYGYKNMEKFWLTDTIYKYYYCPLEKTIEMKGMPLLNLSGHETLQFWMRIFHLKEEINGMDNSDKQFCELKSLLHSFQFQLDEDGNGSMIFMDEGGKMVAACTGEIMEWMSGFDRAKRLIKRIMKDLEGKETQDEDSSVSYNLTKSTQTATAPVQQENLDIDHDSLSEYTSELLEVELLYNLLKFNKAREQWSRPKATWPTSEGFSMLKNFLLEGIHVNWIENLQNHTEEDKWKTVTKSLLEVIEEKHWAAAALLMVADVLERYDTVSANRNLCLFLLDEMYRMAVYLKQMNERPGLWKREATGSILIGSIMCCAQIDPSKFAMFVEEPMDEEKLRAFLWELECKCDRMDLALAKITKAKKFSNADFNIGYLEGESEDEGGPFSEDESSLSSRAKACPTAKTGEEE